MTEEWRTIPGLKGHHEASSSGRVRRLKHVRMLNGHQRTVSARMLKLGVNGQGYLQVSLYKKSMTVHRLVLLAFVGPLPEGMESRHRDGNKLNNRIDNLSYCTRLENAADRTKHGHQICGEDHAHSKLTRAGVRCIRQLAAMGATSASLAAVFDVSASHIFNIINRKRWKHLDA